MSAQTSPSPPPGPMAEIDEARLPSGQCRYILLHPELKGHRCGCVGFTLNRALPGVSCECGHLSCYHVKAHEPSPEQAKLDRLIRRMEAIEGQLDRETGGSLGRALGDTVSRVGNLEDQVERGQEELKQENRDIYGKLSRVWKSVDECGRRQAEILHRLALHDEKLDEYDNSIQKLEERLMQSDDAAIDLEVRLDRLEDNDTTAPENERTSISDPRGLRHLAPSTTSSNSAAMAKGGHPTRASVTLARRTNFAMTPISGPWTVHVSLMPMASVAFPFEKDTNAYKRCLSRGLHQMIAVQATDSESFGKAISTAFGSLLQGRPWVPLQARLCEAETLMGLPMLRPLDAALTESKNYDQDFLRKHCAVCGPNGKLDSLYIAMQSDTFSWHFLQRAPCYFPGLEDSWAYDALLDHNDPLEDDDMDEEDRPSAGDILPPLETLKRTASEMSRTPSFSASGEGEGSRPKVARTGPQQVRPAGPDSCVPVPLELRRRVETV